jgi:hypothetical protein
LLVVLSDLHCGSTVGLLPPDFTTDEGNSIGQTPCQEWLWGCWKDATENWLPSVIDSDPFALVVNGDLVEGLHHGSIQVISPNADDHVKAAMDTLKPLADRAEKAFVTIGTECHTKQRENSIAVGLGAIRDPNTKRGAWDKLYMSVRGVPCRFMHHVSTTTRQHLRAGRLSIALANEQNAAASAGHTIPRVMGAGHCHIRDLYENSSAIFFTTGAWQFGTRHLGKVAPAFLQCPEPSIAVLDFRAGDAGDLPIIHRSPRYLAPEPKGVVL